MRFAVLNTILAVILHCGFSAVVCAERQQEQSQTQPAAQPPASTQPQNEPAQPAQTPPDQAAPAETPPPETPPQGTQAPPPQKQAPQDTAPSSPTKEASAPSAKPKPIKKKRKPVVKSQTGSPDSKVVVRNGGATEEASQISPGMSDQQAKQQRETTSQLLATTDANLKRVSGEQLTSAQQSTLAQINSYVRQSKAASDSGDLSRAQTLAFKAHLLSDELARK